MTNVRYLQPKIKFNSKNHEEMFVFIQNLQSDSPTFGDAFLRAFHSY